MCPISWASAPANSSSLRIRLIRGRVMSTCPPGSVHALGTSAVTISTSTGGEPAGRCARSRAATCCTSPSRLGSAMGFQLPPASATINWYSQPVCCGLSVASPAGAAYGASGAQGVWACAQLAAHAIAATAAKALYAPFPPGPKPRIGTSGHRADHAVQQPVLARRPQRQLGQIVLPQPGSRHQADRGRPQPQPDLLINPPVGIE